MFDRTPPGPLIPPYGWEEGFRLDLYRNLIHEDRWLMIVGGVVPALLITLAGILLGLVIGFVIALMRISRYKILRALGTIYITIIRGIPLLIQIMIWGFVIFVNDDTVPRLFVAFVAFGINSSAYVAEILRAGILSVDRGQTEAGRSLGLNSFKNMHLIVMPQAIKNSLPSLVNEFITLFKDTSLIGVIAVVDITRAVDLIRSRTFTPFLPLMAAALVYLTIVTVLTWVLSIVERRLRKSDTR